MILSIVLLMLNFSGSAFWTAPIKNIVRKGDMPELPASVKEKAVFAIVPTTTSMIMIVVLCDDGVLMLDAVCSLWDV